MVLEIAVVVRALSILQAFEMDLTRLLFLRFVDFPPRFGNQFPAFNFVDDVELQRPNHVRRVLNVSAVFETLE